MSSSESESSSSSDSSRSHSPELEVENSASGEPRDENIDRNLDYKPPKGYKQIEELEDGGEFDWDSLNTDEDSEIWVIRIPDGLNASRLEGLELEGLSRSSTSAKIGSLKRKKASYDIWSVGGDSEHAPVGGEELQGLSCILPRKSKAGEMYLAPKPITQHLLISAHDVQPEQDEIPNINLQNLPRPSYPREMLKGRFRPTGSVLEQTEDTNDVEAGMEVDEVAPPSSQPRDEPQSSPQSAKEERKKSKKRKDPEDPLSQSTKKKPKKPKVDSA